jgi:glycerol uptake facilitator protein
MEFLGTAVLTLGVLITTKITLDSKVAVIVVPMLVMVVLMAIGTALSGTTGYAINPFRDLMPRIVYQVLILMPFANKNEGAD